MSDRTCYKCGQENQPGKKWVTMGKGLYACRDCADQIKSDEEKSCEKCGKTATPLWRVGPKGRNTLCNGCGLKFSKAKNKRRRPDGEKKIKKKKVKKRKVVYRHISSDSEEKYEDPPTDNSSSESVMSINMFDDENENNSEFSATASKVLIIPKKTFRGYDQNNIEVRTMKTTSAPILKNSTSNVSSFDPVNAADKDYVKHLSRVFNNNNNHVELIDPQPSVVVRSPYNPKQKLSLRGDDQIQGHCDRQQQENDNLKEENNSLKRKFDDIAKELKDLEESNKTLKRANSQAEDDRDHNADCAQATVNAFNDHLDTFLNEVHNIDNKIGSNEEKINTFEKENVSLVREKKLLMETLIKLKGSFDNSSKRLNEILK